MDVRGRERESRSQCSHLRVENTLSMQCVEICRVASLSWEVHSDSTAINKTPE